MARGGWFTFVGLGYNVYRIVFLFKLLGALPVAIEPRLGRLEEELAGILAELYGKGVDLVQLLLRKGVYGHGWFPQGELYKCASQCTQCKL